MYLKCTAPANTLAAWTRTSHGTPSAGLRVLFEEYMNLAFVYSQRRTRRCLKCLKFIKRSGVQTQSQHAGVTGRCAELCFRDGLTHCWANYLQLCQQNSNSMAAVCRHSVTKRLSSLFCAAVMPSIFVYSLCSRAQCAPVSHQSVPDSPER